MTKCVHTHHTNFLNMTKNKREKAKGCRRTVSMIDNATFVHDPSDELSPPRQFSYDYSYWSHDGFELSRTGYFKPSDGSKYADQVRQFLLEKSFSSTLRLLYFLQEGIVLTLLYQLNKPRFCSLRPDFCFLYLLTSFICICLYMNG